jgi:hypothetical protein
MAHQSTITDADAGTLLAPVLEGIEAEIGKTGGVLVSINGELPSGIIMGCEWLRKVSSS